MKNRLANILARRRVLLTRIADQRARVAEIPTRWEKQLALADIGFKAVRMANRHPILLSGAVSALLAFRHKGMIAVALLGWRLLHRDPAALVAGYHYLTAKTRSSKNKQESRPDFNPN